MRAQFFNAIYATFSPLIALFIASPFALALFKSLKERWWVVWEEKTKQGMSAVDFPTQIATAAAKLAVRRAAGGAAPTPGAPLSESDEDSEWVGDASGPNDSSTENSSVGSASLVSEGAPPAASALGASSASPLQASALDASASFLEESALGAAASDDLLVAFILASRDAIAELRRAPLPPLPAGGSAPPAATLSGAADSALAHLRTRLELAPAAKGLVRPLHAAVLRCAGVASSDALRAPILASAEPLAQLVRASAADAHLDEAEPARLVTRALTTFETVINSKPLAALLGPTAEQLAGLEARCAVLRAREEELAPEFGGGGVVSLAAFDERERAREALLAALRSRLGAYRTQAALLHDDRTSGAVKEHQAVLGELCASAKRLADSWDAGEAALAKTREAAAATAARDAAAAEQARLAAAADANAAATRAAVLEREEEALARKVSALVERFAAKVCERRTAVAIAQRARATESALAAARADSFERATAFDRSCAEMRDAYAARRQGTALAVDFITQASRAIDTGCVGVWGGGGGVRLRVPGARWSVTYPNCALTPPFPTRYLSRLAECKREEVAVHERHVALFGELFQELQIRLANSRVTEDKARERRESALRELVLASDRGDRAVALIAGEKVQQEERIAASEVARSAELRAELDALERSVKDSYAALEALGAPAAHSVSRLVSMVQARVYARERTRLALEYMHAAAGAFSTAALRLQQATLGRLSGLLADGSGSGVGSLVLRNTRGAFFATGGERAVSMNAAPLSRTGVTSRTQLMLLGLLLGAVVVAFRFLGVRIVLLLTVAVGAATAYVYLRPGLVPAAVATVLAHFSFARRTLAEEAAPPGLSSADAPAVAALEEKVERRTRLHVGDLTKA